MVASSKLSRSEFQPRFRRVGDITILWVAKNIIVANNSSGYSVKFDNLFPRRGDYEKKWKPFSDYCRRSQSIESVFQLIAVADSFDITIGACWRSYDIPPDAVEICKNKGGKC